MLNAAPNSRVGKIASYVDLVGLTDMALADLAAAAELDGLVSDAEAALADLETKAALENELAGLDPVADADRIAEINAELGEIGDPQTDLDNATTGLAGLGFGSLAEAQTDLAEIEQAAIDAQTTEDAALEAAANKSVDVSEPTIADALRDFAEMLGISRFGN